MTNETMIVNVNDEEYTINKTLVSQDDQRTKYEFSTNVNGEDLKLQARLESAALADFAEIGINAESVLIELLEQELVAEIQQYLENK